MPFESDKVHNGRRYARQIILPEIGEEGQKLLERARVLCVGAGGLGSPAALYLASAGVGTLGIIDPDLVDESNLQRQILFKTADVGTSKAKTARSRILEFNPYVAVKAFPFRLQAENALEIFKDFDVIIDGTDNFSARFLINDAAIKLGLPVVHGSLSQFEGRVSVFWVKHGPCYRCVYPKAPKHFIPNCAQAGIIGAAAGVIGTIQAMEAIKLALMPHGNASSLKPLIGRMLVVDMRSMDFRSFGIDRKSDCPVCSIPKEKINLVDTATELCAQHGRTMNEISCNEVLASGNLGSFEFIDVREVNEWRGGHIHGAVHWPLSRLEKGEFPDPLAFKKPLIIYCHAGIRSQKALSALTKKGFTGLRSLAGGLLKWQGPLERDAKP